MSMYKKLSVLIAAFAVACVSFAQTSEVKRERIRGEIVSLRGDVLTVHRIESPGNPMPRSNELISFPWDCPSMAMATQVPRNSRTPLPIRRRSNVRKVWPSAYPTCSAIRSTVSLLVLSRWTARSIRRS